MRSLLSNIQLAKPFFLWLLVLLPLLWLRFRDRSALVIIWRTIIFCLLVVALADPRSVSVSTTRVESIFAFDLSRSIPDSMRSWMRGMAENGFQPREGDRVFVFAGEAREASKWQEWLPKAASPETIRPQRTNLEKLFQTVLAESHSARNLFLFTDGWETEGSVERLFPAIAGSGMRVYPMMPPERPKISNVAVTKLVAPQHGESGESVNLKVFVENQGERAVEGTLTLARDGQTIKTEPVRLEPGSQVFTHSSVLPEGQLISYRASFTPKQPELDLQSYDNQAFAWISVRNRAKVLLLNGRNGTGRYLEETLKRHGLEVTSRPADSPPAPTGFGIVIFNNVEREKFSPSYLASIEKHVAEGNGFLMLGGEASFGPGGYRRTPIETILPVELREPKREERNRAVVLVIDKSGSMREDNRILYAQEAAKVVARQLKDNDLLGVVAFDISPFIIVPIETVGRLRPTFDGQIDRLRPGGQTFFYPALLEAKRQLEKQNAAHKHVILLSDGETRGSQGELIDLINVMKTEMKITVSAIAVGSDADIRIMKRISQYGGGLFHHTIDPRTVPQIALQQLQDKPADEPPAERDFTPVQEKNSQVLASFNVRPYPAVRGFMETELKREAHSDVVVLKENRKMPLLASWRYGKGKSAALTIDLEGRWSRNWIQWTGLQGFWDKVIDWLGPPREPTPNYELRVSTASPQPVLDLYIYEEASADSQFRYTISGKERREGTFKKLARGHFQITLPVARPGDYRLEITEERNGRRITYPPAGYTVPYDAGLEVPQPSFNIRLLEQLAAISGGKISPSSSASVEKQTVSNKYEYFRGYLLALAALLFFVEVALRRLIFGESE